MSALELKEEAKSLLLKGCFRMASHKYATLITLPPDSFSRRDWAILHVNHGLCLHNLDQSQAAIEKYVRAVEIDPTYQKAPYRLLQALQGASRHEEALRLTLKVSNLEIDALLRQIREEYVSGIEIEAVIGKDLPEPVVMKLQERFICKCGEGVFGESTGQRIKRYCEWVGSHQVIYEHFLKTLHREIIRSQKQISEVFSPFWMRFEERISLQSLRPAFWTQITQGEKGLLPYVPPRFYSAEAWVRLIRNLSETQAFFAEVEPNEVFSACLRMIQQMKRAVQTSAIEKDITASSNESKTPKCSAISIALSEFLRDYCANMSGTTTLVSFPQQLFFFDSLAPLLLPSEEKGFFQVMLVRNAIINGRQVSEAEECACLEYLSGRLLSLPHLYVLDQMVLRLVRQKKSLLTEMVEEYEAYCQAKNSRQQVGFLHMSILLKLDIKLQLPAIYKMELHIGDSGHQIALNALLLYCISRKEKRLQVLRDSQGPLLSLLKGSHTRVMVTVNLLNVLLVDIEGHAMEEQAVKMGVTLDELVKARQIQQDRHNILTQKEENSLQQLRLQFGRSLCGTDILLRLCKKETANLKPLLQFLSMHFPQLLLHTPIVEYMLGMRSSAFFISICKGMNVSMLKYVQVQPIVDILVESLATSGHELAIFEALLGLVNLSSLPVRISLKCIIGLLFQENQYIVHGALEVLNNVLINGEHGDQECSSIVQKYHTFYRGNLSSDLPLTDYSHPSRIYCTLLSLAIVLDMPLPELQHWGDFLQLYSRIEGERATALFKAVLYMHQKQLLPPNWMAAVEKDIHALKQVDQSKWLKLRQMFK